MGSLFRSEEMSLVQIFLQYEVAHDTVEELGELGLLQFKDLKHDVNAFHRTFIGEIRKADELDRKLKFFATELQDAAEREPGFATLLKEVKRDAKSDDQYESYDQKFEDTERELQQLKSSFDQLERNYNSMTELRHVLVKDAKFLAEQSGESEPSVSSQSSLTNVRSNGRGKKKEKVDAEPLLENIDLGGDQPVEPTHSPFVSIDLHQPAPPPVAAGAFMLDLGFISGVIARDKLPTFERVLWRSTRGNLFMRQAEIEEPIRDPTSGAMVQKNVFIIFYQGERANQKIKKICESFAANLYPVRQTAPERAAMLSQVRTQMDELRVVLSHTTEQRRRVLLRVASHIEAWTARVTKEKAIYHTLNMFDYDIGRKCLIGEGWCPSASLDAVQVALRRGSIRAGAQIPSILTEINTRELPPTFHRTNKFTKSFQDLVDSYGIARYREVNPAVFTIITFPFLFGVMFGDVGHGLIMLLASLFLVWRERQLRLVSNEMFRTLFSGRYLLVLMSVFGIYAGFLYNEVFSIPLYWGSMWQFDETARGGVVNPEPVNYPPWNHSHTPRFQPFGVDYAWKNSVNELTYLNSLKMKLSIVLGVAQMELGIVLSFMNARYFRKRYDIYFEFIPQIIFLTALFGYMVLLILIKWCTRYHNTSGAPLILNIMINMFMMKHEESDKLFAGQQGFQYFLLLIAVLSVPVMLIAKPYFLWRDKKRGFRQLPDHENMLEMQAPLVSSTAHHHDIERIEPIDDHAAKLLLAKVPTDHAPHNDEHEDFSEVVVHQIIHTIEFVLGAISNTASYLRLWALSLAHAELSYVFWSLIFVKGIKMHSMPLQSVVLFVCFAVWAALTIFVLLIMETLSAFLHALRLHWVEFQNKFYRGDGKRFMPFSFQRILSGEDE